MAAVKREPMSYKHARVLLNPLRRLVHSPHKLVERLNLRPDSIVMELGPGPGYYSPTVAKALPQGKLILIDVQPEMLEMARKRLDDAGCTNVEYRQADATALPAENESVDVVFLSAVLGEIPDRGACLREIHRVLKPGGLISVSETQLGDPHFIPLAELLESVEPEGFKHRGQFGIRINYTANFRKV